MFMITMPLDFKVGDAADCKINGESSRLTWRDADTLVIEPDDIRQIFFTETDEKARVFMCGAPGAAKADVHNFPECVIINQQD